jgi:hypothetical protein
VETWRVRGSSPIVDDSHKTPHEQSACARCAAAHHELLAADQGSGNLPGAPRNPARESPLVPTVAQARRVRRNCKSAQPCARAGREPRACLHGISAPRRETPPPRTIQHLRGPEPGSRHRCDSRTTRAPGRARRTFGASGGVARAGDHGSRTPGEPLGPHHTTRPVSLHAAACACFGHTGKLEVRVWPLPPDRRQRAVPPRTPQAAGCFIPHAPGPDAWRRWL